MQSSFLENLSILFYDCVNRNMLFSTELIEWLNPLSPLRQKDFFSMCGGCIDLSLCEIRIGSVL